MRSPNRSNCRLALLGSLLAVLWQPTCEASGWRAFSLGQAQRQLQASAEPAAGVRDLGGITAPTAAVYDAGNRDVIIVGRTGDGPPVTLDDLAVAFRSVLVHGEEPMVSIDWRADTDRTGKQAVRFRGGIANTRFGKALLEADVALKRLGLGKLPAEMWGVRSYFDMSAEEWRRTGKPSPVVSRFWFKPQKAESFVAVRKGVALVTELRVSVKTEVMASPSAQDQQSGPGGIRDEIGDRFASSLTASFDDVAGNYPQIARLSPLFALTGLAEGLRQWQKEFGVDLSCARFWLEDYRVQPEITPTEFAVIQRKDEASDDGRTRSMTIEGGVDLEALVLHLADGAESAFRDLVIGLRPNPQSLTWDLPLPDDFRGTLSADAAEDIGKRLREMPAFRDLGMSLKREYHSSDGQSGRAAMSFRELSSTAAAGQADAFSFRSTLGQQRYASNIGGVMLAGTAKIAGKTAAEVDLAGGNFSLVVDGKNARIAPETFRKFVTALWAVYFSSQDPGISIDPIGPKVDKHLVRYIGRVINTDLGRVMREADYVMKKWAVGTQRPAIPGFRDIDTWSYYQGRPVLASRRFWFVPEDMRFKRGGDLLLFDAGRMRVKTELLAEGSRGQAAPTDEAFAGFFSEHYDEIAAKYPIYKELFEYAKLVALAKFLKEQGVPLYWFLMANKHLVLTEDSPGTVDELAKGSEHFQGVSIKGGVDLGTESSYVYDQQAVAAIQRALAQLPGSGPASTTLADGGSDKSRLARTVSFDLGQRAYTTVPQHTLTSGKDQRGIRYQTDLALRQQGRTGLELVRYFNPRRRDAGEFGQGWHLLIPYRVEPSDAAKRDFLNAQIPQRMVVENLFTGDREVLTFSTDRYKVAGYVPEKLQSSQIVGLFLMSNASFRLADKLGNQFHFDSGGRLTDMYFSPLPEHHVHVEYADQFTGALAKSPYVVKPADDQRVAFLNVKIPQRVSVKDLLHDRSEVLTFSDKGPIPGYMPQDAKTSRFRLLALLSNAGLHLVDKHGNEVRFDPNWRFESIRPARESRMVRSLSMGGRKATFNYTIDADGRMVIASAALAEDKPHAAPSYAICYEYDEEGRLCRVRREDDSLAAVGHDRAEHVAMVALPQ